MEYENFLIEEKKACVEFGWFDFLAFGKACYSCRLTIRVYIVSALDETFFSDDRSAIDCDFALVGGDIEVDVLVNQFEFLIYKYN